MRPAVLAAFMAAAALCCGCFVKEDRSLCPCILELDFSSVGTAVISESGLLVETADGFFYHDSDIAAGLSEIARDGRQLRLYRVKIPKSRAFISVVCGADRQYSHETGIIIPEGEECPPLFMFHAEADAVGEIHRETVCMYKDYCKITVRILDAESPYPYLLNVRGNVGRVMLDRSVSGGDFSFSFMPDSDGCGSVRVPRQVDNSLVLQVVDDGKVLREFALGEYIAESGYDWTKENLDDVTVEIDYANSYMTVEIAGWTGNFEFEVII